MHSQSRLIIQICLTCFLFSCGKQNNWSHEKIHSNYEKFSYSKVIYQTNNPVHGIDLEFVQLQDCLKTYLVIHSIPVPFSKNTPKNVTVRIEIDEVLMTCQADHLEGGQRFLLSEKAAQTMIDALAAKKNLIISIPGYQSTIQAEGFSKHFEKIRRSFMENPFHLPF